MIGERVALLIGLIVIPLLLLLAGRRFRDRTPRQRALFWGVLIGHTTGMLITLVLAMFPPVWWHQGPMWRDFLVHFSMLIGAMAGAGVGFAGGRQR